MKNNLAKNTIILSFCTILNKGLLFVMIPLFSKWLSVSDYGSYDVYATYITLLIPIITLACSDAIFRLTIDKENINEQRYYITNGFTIVFVNTLITVILLLIYGKVTGWVCTIPFILLLVGETIDNYMLGFLRAIKKLNIYALTKTVSVVGTAIMVTTFVRFLNLGLNGIMYGYALGFFMSIFFSVFVTKWWKYLNLHNISLKGVKELISYSYALIPNSISWWVINVSDRTIIKLFLGTVYNGIYGIAYKIPNLCSAIFSMFSISWQEVASEMVDAKERNSYFIEIYNKTIKILLSLCSGIISCNFFFFEILFDSKYYEGHCYTAILIASVIFSSIAQFFGGIQISLKNPKANGISTVIGAITNIFIHLALVKIIGLYAATVSTLISNVIVCIIRILQLKNVIKFHIDRRNFLYAMFFLYLCIMSVYKLPLYINVINVFIAAIMFVLANREIINKILGKCNILKGRC